MYFRTEGRSPGLEQLVWSLGKEGGARVSLSQELGSRHRFYKETGKAEWLIEIPKPEADTDETWGRIVDLSKMMRLPVKVFGGFTNTLISQQKFKGILVVHHFPRGKGGITYNRRKRTITASGAVPLTKVVNFACDRGLDLSYLAGIPGTLGGATVGNSGRSSTGENIGDDINSVVTYNLMSKEKAVFNLKKTGGFFRQRGSFLADMNYPTTKLAVRSVTLAPRFIGKKAKEKLAERKEERKFKNRGARFSAGSFWINKLEGLPEGGLTRRYIRRLIEERVRLNEPYIEYSKFYQFLKIGSGWGRKPTDVDVAAFLERTIKALNHRFGFKPRSEVTILGPNGALSVEEYINASIR